MEKTFKEKKKIRAFDVVNVIIMLILTAIFVLPFWIIITVSLSENTLLLKNGPGIWFRGFSFEGYKFLFSMSDIFARSILNSLVVSFAAAILSVIVCTFAAFALSVKTLPFRKFFNVFFVIPMFFSGGTIPLFLVIRAIGIYNTIWALILPGVAGSYYIVLVRNYFYSISPSLSEAARLDGANYFVLAFKIYMPLAVPMMLTIGFMSFVGKWNDWMSSLLYLSTQNSKLWTSQYVLQQILSQIQSIFGSTAAGSASSAPLTAVKNAGIVIVILPLLVIAPLLQKYYVKGLMAGSVKG